MVKRVAIRRAGGSVTMYTFLGINGWEIVSPEPEVVQLMLDVVERDNGGRRLMSASASSFIHDNTP